MEKDIVKKQKAFKEASIVITKEAAHRLKTVMKEQHKSNFALRISVEGGGCSGMSYKMDFDKDQKEFDKVFNQKGLKVLCDMKSWLYLKDMVIDYSDDLLKGGFKFKNPNADRTCGCGTSFSA